MSDLASVFADTTVLIPAAGRVPEGLLSLSNIGCVAQIPVAGRPVIYWTLTYLRSLGFCKFVMAVPKRGLFVEDLVECTVGRECEFTFVAPDDSSGKLGDTVELLLKEVKTKSALVVLGDTHFQFADVSVLSSDKPILLTAPVLESYRWNLVETDESQSVTAFRDKVKGLQPPLNAVIGVYFFPDVAKPRNAIEKLRPNSLHIDFTAVLDEVRQRVGLTAVPAGTWQDVGHPDRQANSTATLLQKREFNELSVDPVLSTITKRSRMKAKFVDEINYLRLLPQELSVLFPRVLNYSIDWNDPFVTMEYYGYSTLAEVFVYENVDPGIWENVFRHLLAVLTGPFRKYQRPVEPKTVRDFYLNKTRDRLAAMDGSDLLKSLNQMSSRVRINGRSYHSLDSLWPRIEEDVERLAATSQGGIIHGDLCFSNILYDLRAGVCKFIDARGSFGATGIFGDPRYDVAKLYHSVFGLYDFITNDLFHIRHEGDNLIVDIRKRNHHAQILERFERVFFQHYDRREILLITGLIFAGIPALHYDKPQRQIAMLARAIEIFGDLYAF